MIATSGLRADTAISVSPVNGQVIGLIVSVCWTIPVPAYPRSTANGSPAAPATYLFATVPADGHGATAVARVPERRLWGFTVQLYSLRSRDSWGHGDLHDLAELAAWSARDLGAGFVLINPLHAAEPLPPVSPSAYLPMSRRWSSPLYLRIEDIPEYKALDYPERTRLTALGSPLRAAG